ncbi:MAG: stage II sporulation protein R [Clostridia bacterium]|nr:stage II sporulation protein R [Clostridia bacterium]
MKRMLILLLIVLTLLTGWPRGRATDAAADVLRLHILANSDSPADQAVKLRVRDALLPLFETAPSYEDARAFVLSHGAALLETCQRALATAGVAYGAQLLLGVSDFPDRTYNGIRFPAGDYDALQIVLGDGAGHNWWCVLFPPLCIVTRDGSSQDGAVPDTAAPVVFESDILAFLRKHFGWDVDEP